MATPMNVGNTLSALTSHAKKLGIFNSVEDEELESAPTGNLALVIFPASGQTVPKRSGLDMTSMSTIFTARMYANKSLSIVSGISRKMVDALDKYLAGLHTDLELGRTDTHIDLFGIDTNKLSWTTGFTPLQDGLYRTIEITIPILFDDVYTQEL